VTVTLFADHSAIVTGSTFPIRRLALLTGDSCTLLSFKGTVPPENCARKAKKKKKGAYYRPKLLDGKWFNIFLSLL
jgi:hypothetical protein